MNKLNHVNIEIIFNKNVSYKEINPFIKVLEVINFKFENNSTSFKCEILTLWDSSLQFIKNFDYVERIVFDNDKNNQDKIAEFLNNKLQSGAGAIR
jgi:hypothetical protein